MCDLNQLEQAIQEMATNEEQEYFLQFYLLSKLMIKTIFLNKFLSHPLIDYHWKVKTFVCIIEQLHHMTSSPVFFGWSTFVKDWNSLSIRIPLNKWRTKCSEFQMKLFELSNQKLRIFFQYNCIQFFHN